MAERQASKKRTAISSAAGERSPRKGGVKRSQPRTKSLPGRERSNKRLPSEHEADAQDNASPKAARLSKDLGIKKVLRTPSTPTSRIASATPSNASPTPAAAICTSKRERINVNYDMRYHPADQILRPNHLHTKLALSLENRDEQTNIPEGSNTECRIDDCNGDDDDGNSEIEEEKNLPAPMKRKAQLSRQSTRSGRKVKPANYDIRYHPMDKVIKPSDSATYAARVQKPVLDMRTNATINPRKGLSPLLKSPKTAKDSNFHVSRSRKPASHEVLSADPVLKRVADLGKFDHRLFFLAQESHGSWPHVVTRLLKEQLTTRKELVSNGGIKWLKKHLEKIRGELEEQLDLDDDSIDNLDVQRGLQLSIEGDPQNTDAADDDAALPSIESGDPVDEESELRSGQATSPAHEMGGSPGTSGKCCAVGALFNGPSSNTKPELLSDDAVSELPNEQLDTRGGHISPNASSVAQPYQTVQVVIYADKFSKNRSTPSAEQTQRRDYKKKWTAGPSEFAVYEDRPGTRSSAKVKTPKESRAGHTSSCILY